MNVDELNLSSHPEFDNHEGVFACEDPRTGLRAMVAIHSTALGPAAGGTRRWHYADESAAITDVLRLSKGMSYKNAMAALPFGGGKAVILSESRKDRSPAEFRAFGRFVQSLEGRYITAEDVGVGTDDMRWVREETPYVSGLPRNDNTAGGDPSPWTALGVFLSIQQAVERESGSDSLHELSVAVQGVGHVGLHLCRFLNEAGVRLVVADVNRANVERATQEFGATKVEPEEILFAHTDVLAPCALGGILNETSVPKISAPLIAGAANNQLATAEDGNRLQRRNVLFLPDYVINAGGIIAVAREYLGGYTSADVASEVAKIRERVDNILELAKLQHKPPSEIADQAARQAISAKHHRRELHKASR